MPFPLIKIGALFIRTLSKPVAKSLKSYVATHPITANHIGKLGQMNHRFWTEVTIRSAGHKGLRIKPLDEATALSQGADAFSEIFVFSVAGVCIVAELGRNHIIKKKDEEIAHQKYILKENEMIARLNTIDRKLNLIEKKQRGFRESLL
mmetsp:Transcript_10368/g.12581  ORF Transcript_10368/g.12581 Transcript_10368/m.12581 type:complete len:149 (+) Transcript_10368:66-512(+)